MLQILQAFGGPGRTAVSFAPTYSMYPEYARDAMTDWVVGHREEDFSLDVDHAVEVIAKHRPSVVLLPSPNNPTGTALPPETVTAVCAAAAEVDGIVVIDEAYGEFRRAGTPSALEVLRGDAEPGRHPHDEQGVRAGRRPARLPGRLDRDHRRAARRAAALPPLGGHPGRRAGGAPARRRAARPGRRPAGRARPHGGLAARAGADGRGQRRQLRAVRPVRRPPRGLAGSTGPRRADPRDRAGRLAPGVHRHARGDDDVQDRP